MVLQLPGSVLFCCDHNAVRSPMAEGIMKQFYGAETYVQSVGVMNDKKSMALLLRFAPKLGSSCRAINPVVLTRWSNGAMTFRRLT